MHYFRCLHNKELSNIVGGHYIIPEQPYDYVGLAVKIEPIIGKKPWISMSKYFLNENCCWNYISQIKFEGYF